MQKEQYLVKQPNIAIFFAVFYEVDKYIGDLFCLNIGFIY